jgi:hypothetical protein
MAFQRRPNKPRDSELYALIKNMSDDDLQKGVELLMREQAKREHSTFRPIQAFGDFIQRHG